MRDKVKGILKKLFKITTQNKGVFYPYSDNQRGFWAFSMRHLDWSKLVLSDIEKMCPDNWSVKLRRKGDTYIKDKVQMTVQNDHLWFQKDLRKDQTAESAYNSIDFSFIPEPTN